jgi:hypothetical protein
MAHSNCLRGRLHVTQTPLREHIEVHMGEDRTLKHQYIILQLSETHR